MSLETHPGIGAIVRVDLSEGFRIPEMRKRRPAVILCDPALNRPQLCTIVPFSTTPDRSRTSFAVRIELDRPLPFPYEDQVMWAKCDMVMTVAFHRLKLLHMQQRRNGEREYVLRFLSGEKLAEIRQNISALIGA